ncbi:MAG: hypothetical protein HZA50_15635 [Planctomycetes bacterium]|nr:hypothetical protein [Planctomycetota bacterium]
MKTGIIIGMLLAATISLGLVELAMAKPNWYTEEPIERLIKNVTAYIKEHPDDAKGYYTLGLVHYDAFAHKKRTVSVLGGDAGDKDGKRLPGRVIRLGSQSDGGKTKETPTDEQLFENLTDAIKNFRKAISIDSENSLYHLGLACILESGAEMSDKVAAR